MRKSTENIKSFDNNNNINYTNADLNVDMPCESENQSNRKEEYDYELIYQYINEIERLNKENNELIAKNEILHKQIKNENNDKSSNILNEIRELLHLTNNDDITSSVKLIEENKNDSIKNEFVDKVITVYEELTGDTEGDIKKAWKWIAMLINSMKALLNEKSQFETESKMYSKNHIYKEYWSDLMKEHNIETLDELKTFINTLLEKDHYNELQMEKMKSTLEKKSK